MTGKNTGLGLIVLTFFSACLIAAERPKIGLALSGGGARGMTHIGVLKALEEKQIPIDYIAGSSMGSIIGGLYATGMSTDDLEWMAKSINWEETFRPSVDRAMKNYRQKQEEKDYFVDIEIGISKGKAKSGNSIAGGHKIMLELQRMVGVIDTQSFDDYPIPFRAVATDLNAGEPYIIDHGDLATAMRASMAVPLVFGPVKHQGRMLVDGGILNNLPVDVVRQMGADIVIAVDISSPLGVVNENSSVLSITYQSVDVALVQNTIQSLKLADIIIAPELIGTSASDFEKTDAMIADGYKATMAKSLVLNGFRLDKQQYLTHLDSRNYLPRSIPQTISFVDFAGNKRTSSKRLKAQSKALIGKEFNNDMVQQVADAIVVFEEDIEIISYNIAKKNGEGGVVFNVQEKQWGPDYLKFGLKIADDFDSNTRISVLTRHHRYNINSKGGQWINDFSIGSTLSWKSELYQPIDFNNKYFATANLHTIKDTRRFYINDGAVGEYDFKQFAFGLSLGINPNENSEFRAGLWYQDENVAQVINAINFDTAINDTVGLKINYGIDTLEKVIYPRRGFDLKTEIGVFDQIQWFSFDGFKRFPFFANSAAHIGFKADFTDLVNNNEFFKAYGGLDDFAGFPQHSLLGLNAFIAEAGWFTQLQTLTFPVIGTPDIILKTHWGNVWQGHIKLENMIYGASAGLSFDIQNTLLFLGSGYSRQGDFRFYLRLGTGF